MDLVSFYDYNYNVLVSFLYFNNGTFASKGICLVPIFNFTQFSYSFSYNFNIIYVIDSSYLNANLKFKSAVIIEKKNLAHL